MVKQMEDFHKVYEDALDRVGGVNRALKEVMVGINKLTHMRPRSPEDEIRLLRKNVSRLPVLLQDLSRLSAILATAPDALSPKKK